MFRTIFSDNSHHIINGKYIENITCMVAWKYEIISSVEQDEK